MKPAIPARVNPYGQPDGEGKFKPGNPGGPGRPKGSRNKVGNDLKAMILNAAMRAGAARLGRNAGPSARRGGLNPIRFDRRI
jgi:hypothetical protein